MSELTRRRVLAASGAVGAMAIAGCTSSAEEDDEGSGDDESNPPEPTGTRLGEITVENLDDQGHTVDVLVEFDGEIEHWSTHELDETTEGVTLEGDWPDERGNFRVTARLDEGDFTQVTPANWNDPGCLNLFISVRPDGTIRIPGVTDGGPCGNGDVDITDAEDATETDDDGDSGDD
ncbi:twin-arginine translocation signal domain-containing protein [Natrialbaceae archaeon A-CW3]